MSASSSVQPPRATTPSKDDLELERLLNREASAFQRQVEVDRILKAFKFKYVSIVTVVSDNTDYSNQSL